MVDKLRNILAPSCNDGLRERVCFFHGLRRINSDSAGFRRAFSTKTRPRLRMKSLNLNYNQPPARWNAGCLPASVAGIPIKQPFVAVFPMSLGDFAPKQIGSALGQSHSALGQIGSAPGQTHSASGEIRSDSRYFQTRCGHSGPQANVCRSKHQMKIAGLTEADL
jgi:hypothetical protein